MRFLKRIMPAVALLGLMPLGANAGLVTLHSGNGTVGGTDSLITYEQGPFGQGFATPLGASDFTAAATGPAASIVTPNSSWLPGNAGLLTGDPGANWVATVPTASTAFGYTGLYAISFNIGSVDGPATLKFEYAADNYLGNIVQTGPNTFFTNAGLFLNGVAIPGGTNTGPNGSGGLFANEQTLTLSLAGLLNPGVNTLYIDVANNGAYSGVIFSATISAVPEPSTVFMGATAAIFGLVAYRRRKRVAA